MSQGTSSSLHRLQVSGDIFVGAKIELLLWKDHEEAEEQATIQREGAQHQREHIIDQREQALDQRERVLHQREQGLDQQQYAQNMRQQVQDQREEAQAQQEQGLDQQQYAQICDSKCKTSERKLKPSKIKPKSNVKTSKISDNEY
ncbi:hypothetical protein LTR33_006947 [Friedmanniomyces endolithicus]|nr:hypothetical protein LTR33_006947 [Friedmanniomyces endolithicus]